VLTKDDSDRLFAEMSAAAEFKQQLIIKEPVFQ